MSTSYEYEFNYHSPARNGSSSGRLAPLLLIRISSYGSQMGRITQLTGSQVGDVIINVVIFTHITILIGFLDDLRVVLCCNIVHLMKSAARCQLIACTCRQGFNHLLGFGISRTGGHGHFLSFRRGLLQTSVLVVPRISGRSS